MPLLSLLLAWTALTFLGVGVLVAIEPLLSSRRTQRGEKRTGTWRCARAHIEVCQPGSSLSS